jgi:hypothetical protein
MRCVMGRSSLHSELGRTVGTVGVEAWTASDSAKTQEAESTVREYQRAKPRARPIATCCVSARVWAVPETTVIRGRASETL